ETEAAAVQQASAAIVVAERCGAVQPMGRPRRRTPVDGTVLPRGCKAAPRSGELGRSAWTAPARPAGGLATLPFTADKATAQASARSNNAHMNDLLSKALTERFQERA